MGIHYRAVFRAQVPIIKPAQKHKYNTQTVEVKKVVQVQKNEIYTEKTKNNNMASIGKNNTIKNWDKKHEKRK